MLFRLMARFLLELDGKTFSSDKNEGNQLQFFKKCKYLNTK